MEKGDIERILDDIIALLERHEVTWWPEYLADLRTIWHRAVKSGSVTNKRAPLRRLRELFGGMGSLNDVYINEVAGDAILPEERSAVNKELNRLTDALYAAVQEERQAIE